MFAANIIHEKILKTFPFDTRNKSHIGHPRVLHSTARQRKAMKDARFGEKTKQSSCKGDMLIYTENSSLSIGKQ